jgi:hypothetical protein
MLHRKLYQFCAERRPVWVFLRDQQRWIEEALVEESVRLDSIGAVSTRLSYVCRAPGEELPTADDCPEAERLSG